MIRHSDIRTYTFSEASNNLDGFALKQMSDVYTEQFKESERPHRHDYYVLLFIEKGRGIHYIDFNEYPVMDSSIFFLLPGQMHQILFSDTPKGTILLFTEEFLLRNSISEKLIDDIYLFKEYGISPPLSIGELEMPLYKNILEQMDYFGSSLSNYTTDAVGSLLKLFLIQCNNRCSVEIPGRSEMNEGAKHLLRPFKHLLSDYFNQWHMVTDYATELAVTADYLNKVLKNLTGTSAKDHIQNKLILEAKRSLIFTDVTNKELAFELGFEEAAHFNNFFKKMTGLTPSEFRNNTRKT